MEDWSEYKKPDSLRSCDKGSHRSRSEVNSPNHLEHWRKENKEKRKEILIQEVGKKKGKK